MTLGDIDVIPLTDGRFRLDGGAMFGVVPKTLWSQRTSADEFNRVPLSLTPLLIRTAGLNVLIDAGIGDKLPAKWLDMFAVDRHLTLDESLAAIGLTPDDIHVVIATHLHLDHAGGFTTIVDGVARPRFRRARYLVRRGEWDDAVAPNERNRASYLPDDFVPLAAAGVIEFIEGDGEVLPGISVWQTGGHTKHHQIVRIDSAGRTGLFMADLVPTVAHLSEAWTMGYDLYPLETLAARKHWLRLATEGEYVIFFEHDPAVAAGLITLKQGRRQIEPLIAAP